MSVPAVTAPPALLERPVPDVCAAARFFRQILVLPVHLHSRTRADVDLGPDLVLGLHEGTPSGPAAIIEMQVPDLWGALAELRRRGATVLVEPVLTEWGTESAFVAGPDGLVVELHRPR